MFRKTGCIALTAALFLAAYSAPPQEPAQDRRTTVLLVDIDAAINPVTAEYITGAVDRANTEGYHAVVLQMDTPGGLLESTRLITKSFLASDVPIIVYVAPAGARAASAGVFISYAAHIVAMAPSTNIGAATPVNMSGAGGPDSTQTAMMDKVTNDAVAQMRTMAEKRGRNADWAESAIRDAVSIGEQEALEKNVVNLIAPTLDSLLSAVDGMTVTTASGDVVLATRDAVVERRPMNWRDRALYNLANPNFAYIFLMLGIYGLFFELSNPGSVFPGVIGAICLILAFYSMQTLPVNYAGLLLIGLALLLFVLEIKITSYGLLTVGGIVSMVIGSLMLFKTPESFTNPIEISMEIIVTFTILTAAFFLVAVTFALRAQRNKVTTGQEGLVGEIGEARTRISPEGKVSVHGEIWKAYTEGEIKKGERVRVLNVEGMRLKIERA